VIIGSLNVNRIWLLLLLATFFFAWSPEADADELRASLGLLQDAKTAGNVHFVENIWDHPRSEWLGHGQIALTQWLRNGISVGVIVIGVYLVFLYCFAFFFIGYLFSWLIKYSPYLHHTLHERYGFFSYPLTLLLMVVAGLPLTWRYATPSEKRIIKELFIFYPILLLVLSVAPYLFAAKVPELISFTLEPELSNFEFYLRLWDINVFWPFSSSFFPWLTVSWLGLALAGYGAFIWAWQRFWPTGRSAFCCNLCGQKICGKCSYELNEQFLCQDCFKTRETPGDGEPQLLRRLKLRQGQMTLAAILIPGYEAFASSRVNEGILVLLSAVIPVALSFLPRPKYPFTFLSLKWLTPLNTSKSICRIYLLDDSASWLRKKRIYSNPNPNGYFACAYYNCDDVLPNASQYSPNPQIEQPVKVGIF